MLEYLWDRNLVYELFQDFLSTKLRRLCCNEFQLIKHYHLTGEPSFLRVSDGLQRLEMGSLLFTGIADHSTVAVAILARYSCDFLSKLYFLLYIGRGS
jgi:hypothetical protein